MHVKDILFVYLDRNTVMEIHQAFDHYSKTIGLSVDPPQSPSRGSNHSSYAGAASAPGASGGSHSHSNKGIDRQGGSHGVGGASGGGGAYGGTKAPEATSGYGGSAASGGDISFYAGRHYSGGGGFAQTSSGGHSSRGNSRNRPEPLSMNSVGNVSPISGHNSVPAGGYGSQPQLSDLGYVHFMYSQAI